MTAGRRGPEASRTDGAPQDLLAATVFAATAATWSPTTSHLLLEGVGRALQTAITALSPGS